MVHYISTAPIASGRSDIAGWDLHPLRNAALSRRTPTPDPQGTDAAPSALGEARIENRHRDMSTARSGTENVFASIEDPAMIKQIIKSYPTPQ
jgi:hypothetical protein